MRAKRLNLLWVGLLTTGLNVGASAEQVPLVEAVKKGDAAAVRTLLQQKVDVNTVEADGSTALHWASHRGNLEMATVLIAAGANVKAANRFGATPLALACAVGAAPVADLMLKSGADANAASPQGETALMTAALTGNVAILQSLVAHGANVNAKEPSRGQTALMWAVIAGHLPAVEALLAAGAEVNARAEAGFTPLLFAVRQGHIPLVRVLLKAGANPNDQHVDKLSVKGKLTGEEGVTSALVLAIINAHYELAALLLEHGADLNAPDARGSALHALAWMRRPGLPEGRDNAPPPRTGAIDSLELVKILLAKGANPNGRITWKEIRFDRDDGEARDPPSISVGRSYISYVGATPFYLAAKNADVPLMQLLATAGADPLLPTVQKVTPLMAAAGLGFWEGETPSPLTGLREGERLEAVKLALQLGNDVRAATDFGDIPLVGDRLQLLQDYPDNLEEFPEGALGDMRWGGVTALHAAAVPPESPEQLAIIQLLVEKGARLDARNKLGWTPLMLAEGVKAGGHIRKSSAAADLLRRLMQERNLDPTLYSQAGAVSRR